MASSKVMHASDQMSADVEYLAPMITYTKQVG